MRWQDLAPSVRSRAIFGAGCPHMLVDPRETDLLVTKKQAKRCCYYFVKLGLGITHAGKRSVNRGP
jgi:hypothetical protein